MVRRDHRGVGDRSEIDEDDTVRELSLGLGSGRYGEACLPDATGTGQCQEANLRSAQQSDDDFLFTLAIDQGGERCR